MNELEHCKEFTFVDQVCTIDKECGSIEGYTTWNTDDPYLRAHFPKSPIVPGVLQIEALVQIGGILMRSSGFTESVWLLFVENAKFRNAIPLGNMTMLRVEKKHQSHRAWRLQGWVFMDQNKVSEATFTLGH